ncbi:MAG: glycine--tRNA ligase [Candidatus Falkowbacteria bacterium]|nr:glycine--tRNA ligase [Candidatus Falkowbacteria bacterium]
MQKIVSLCKRRGFIFPCCEIYGGFANAYTYGPYGVELKNNIKKLWWKMFVQEREEIIGIDGPILLHPMLWEASGHTEGFNDALVDCKECKFRFRADHLVKEATGRDLEGNPEAMSRILLEEKIRCPNCGQSNWTEARLMNMMFETAMNSIEGPVYLRPETAGAIFVEFNNIIDAMHPPLPFGIAQIGKAFRNEIVARNFIFRIREFEQMEIEYFIHPQADWEKIFYFWLAKQEDFALAVGVKKEELRRFEHPKEKLAHYSKKTIDVEYNFPFGWGELYGLAQRSNFDLTQHAKYSKKKLEYTDPKTNEKFVPHVIEPTFGLDRTILVALLSAYAEEQVADGERVVLKLPLSIVPVQVAIFPLLKNKPQLVEKAKSIFVELKNKYMCEFDDNGNIGKRYRRQDEIGTPFCVTVDFDSLENGDVTVRDRDSMKQERVKIAELKNYFEKKFER